MPISNLIADSVPVYSGKVLSWFRPMARSVLALVSAKLVKNWQAEYAKFLDIDDPKLNLNVYIRHKSVILNERIGTPKGKKMKIPKEIQPTINVSRYLIIISLISYKNNVLYYLSS